MAQANFWLSFQLTWLELKLLYHASLLDFPNINWPIGSNYDCQTSHLWGGVWQLLLSQCKLVGKKYFLDLTWCCNYTVWPLRKLGFSLALFPGGLVKNFAALWGSTEITFHFIILNIHVTSAATVLAIKTQCLWSLVIFKLKYLLLISYRQVTYVTLT